MKKIFHIRPANAFERLYASKAFVHPQKQDGFIGFFTERFDENGPSEKIWNGPCKTDEFGKEFDELVNWLREGENPVLVSLGSIRRFCEANPDAAVGDPLQHYVFRINTEKYTYMLRLNHQKDLINAFVFCFLKDWIDTSLAN